MDKDLFYISLFLIVIGVAGIALLAYGIIYYFYIVPYDTSVHISCLLVQSASYGNNIACTPPNTTLQFEVIPAGVIVIIVSIAMFVYIIRE